MASPTLPLLPMAPHLVEKIWGGSRLGSLGRRAAAGDAPVGESWEAAALPSGQSRVARGPLAGRELGEVVREAGEALCGRGASTFPLVVKWIETEADLSIQVHPRESGLGAPDSLRKDESWYVLEAQPEARVLHGLREGVTREEVENALREDRSADCLRAVPVGTGDVVRVPPGTIHAIGAGILLLEVQEPSDTTFRVSDFGRLGSDGQPRALHVEEALASANFGAQPPEREKPRAEGEGTLLVDAGAYRLERLVLPERRRVPGATDGRGPVVVIALAEPVWVERAGEVLELGAYETAIIPAEPHPFALEAVSARASVLLAGIGGEPLLGPNGAG